MVSNRWHKSFEALYASECEGVTYQRRVKMRKSTLAIIAPHGGGIEPGTSEIARAIAGFRFSYYTFDGLRQNNNRSLHITSTSFDEPKCLRLVNNSEIVIAVHGCAGEEKVIRVGGLYAELKTRLIKTLMQAGFEARLAGVPYAGTQLQNICNRGRSGKGVQFEISEGLRRSMFKGLDRQARKTTTDVFCEFVTSVHEELRVVAQELDPIRQ